VTGFWIPVRGEDTCRTGSLGVGILLEPGMVAYERVYGSCAVEFEGICIDRGPVEVILTEGRVANHLEIVSSIPPGVGGAVSAFISLSLSCEALKAMGKPCSSREGVLEASRMAHRAEVIALTGLGDVIAMVTGGGLVMRLMAGAPGVGSAIAINDPMLGSVEFTLAQIDKGATTPEILRGMWEKIYEHGRKAYKDFEKSPGLEAFLEAARRFSRGVGFLDRGLEEGLEKALAPYSRRGSVLGYYVKKSLAVVAHERGLGTEILRSLGGVGSRVKRVFGVYRVAYRGFEAVE